MRLLRLRRKKKKIKLDDKEMQVLVKKELEPYLKRDDLQGYLDKIQKDEEKKKIWDKLSSRKKLKLLRYVLAKKGVQHGKK